MVKKRILIIDDEIGYAEVIKVVLEESRRYEVDLESRASQAVAAVKRVSPDLILLDLVMPEAPGSEIASRLLEDPETCRIPIVFLTAAVRREESESKGGRIGGRFFLSKMTPISEILQYLDRFWQTAGLSQGPFIS